MGFDRQVVNPLNVEDQRPSRGLGSQDGQQFVIVTGSSAQPLPGRIERQAGDEHPVDRPGSGHRTIRSRLGYPFAAGDKVPVEVGYFAEPEGP